MKKILFLLVFILAGVIGGSYILQSSDVFAVEPCCDDDTSLDTISDDYPWETSSLDSSSPYTINKEEYSIEHNNINYTVAASIKDHDIYNDVYFIDCPEGCDENNNNVLDALDSYDNYIVSPDMKAQDFFKSAQDAYIKIGTGSFFKKGSKGEGVKTLQNNLNIFSSMTGLSLGFLSPDGMYGPVTTSVVKLFQTYQGITADGIVGVRTLGVLDGVFAGDLVCPPFCKILDSTENSERFITLDGEVYDISDPECPSFCEITPINISIEDIDNKILENCTLFCDIVTGDGEKTVLILNEVVYDISPVQCPPGCRITAPNGESFIILDGKVYDSELLFSDGQGSVDLGGKTYDTSAEDDCAPSCDITDDNKGVSVILDGKVYDTSSDICPPWCVIIPSDIITGLLVNHDMYFMSCLSDCDQNSNDIPDVLETFEIESEEEKVYEFNFIRTTKASHSNESNPDVVPCPPRSICL